MEQPKFQEGAPSGQNLPSYSNKQPYNQQPPPPHTTVVVPVQPTDEPDYLAYSIFTMLCCCLPLGIASLVYSIKTRDANRMGNSTLAERNSSMAWNLAHSALCVGIVLIIVYTVVFIVRF